MSLTPIASGSGLSHVVRVVRGAVAEHLGVDPRAARASLLELLEHERARPSPITNPSRVASNGREARGGCSSSAARPRIAQNPARISGWMHASVPPAITASASPRRMSSAPSPTACEPVAQAETGA